MEALRSEFPVLERVSYLNAGTNGPVPRAAAEAAERSLREQAEHGRGGTAFFESLIADLASLRERVAGLLGCPPGDVALTGSTTDGFNTALAS
ncbi:MAG TPA: hypothetical protein VEQ61_01055, partial [Thermoleophilaceae bacterium]|nr:hypothetical protein [Thermoleophilaceae bacterium]